MESMINIIFPIAGEGSRFGYKFKPFLEATEKTFIELAKKPFDKLKDSLTTKFIFICTHEQDTQYKVEQTLKSKFINDNIIVYKINKTKGPFETVFTAVKTYNIEGLSFICDCDHSIDITPFKNYNSLVGNNIIIPVWNYPQQDAHLFGKIKINENNQIIDFCEKENLSCNNNEKVMGILGCYLFSNIETILSVDVLYENFSGMFKDIITNKMDYKLSIVKIENACFFGTPKQLESFRLNRSKNFTIFLDIDGTILNQETKEIIEGSIETIKKWKLQGHNISLTTASSKEYVNKYLLDCLNHKDIQFDNIITDLNCGPRIVINDKKPYNNLYMMARGINIKRNSGISNIDLNDYNYPIILQKFQGASFAETYLCELNNKKFVRKIIDKNTSNHIHVDILRRQVNDLKQWYFLAKDLVPKIVNEYDNEDCYFYDMEYLENYKTLSSFSEEIIFKTIYKILSQLNNEIYCIKKVISEPKNWLNTFISEKITPKLNNFKTDSNLSKLFFHQGIYINGKKYNTIEYYINNLNDKVLHYLAPSYENLIHGDLTLENILYNGDKYKLIDNSGGRYLDATELDIAKLFQSIIFKYKDWDNISLFTTDLSQNNSYTISEEFTKFNHLENECVKVLLKMFLDGDVERNYIKGIFFTSMYFIRMVPFMYKKSESQCVFTILLTHLLLSFVIDKINNLKE